MVLVKGGTFIMGTNSGDKDEKPAHEVLISDFYIGKHEVTQSEWMKYNKFNRCKFKGNDLPVENVSWFEVIKYCNDRSIDEGLEPCYNFKNGHRECDFRKNGYRLPTEAEWEYAAQEMQVVSKTLYSGSNNLMEVAWYWSNSGLEFMDKTWDFTRIQDNKCQTHPVEQLSPNKLGLYDMSGNVREWCWDLYGDFSKSDKQNPKGNSSGVYRVVKGGSWVNFPENCRIKNRFGHTPTLKYSDLGFRLCRTSNNRHINEN
jgi:formylglycine-generating enzyme required for sulfatase activity